MKTYQLNGLDITIDIREICKESKGEWCAYYTIYLKNKNNEDLHYLDFDYFEKADVVEDEIFTYFLVRRNPFIDAIDDNGDAINYEVFVDFLGKDWFDSMNVLGKLSRR